MVSYLKFEVARKDGAALASGLEQKLRARSRKIGKSKSFWEDHDFLTPNKQKINFRACDDKRNLCSGKRKIERFKDSIGVKCPKLEEAHRERDFLDSQKK